MNAVEARQGGYLLFDTLSGTYKVFGTGYGNYNDSVYYSSFAEIMFCTGYIGLVLVMLLFLGPLRKGSIFQKVLAVSCVLLMSGGGIYTASYLCLYLPLLVYKNWDIVKFEPNTPSHHQLWFDAANIRYSNSSGETWSQSRGY